MMENGYRDIVEGTFVPDIAVTKNLADGLFTATSMGLSVTHYDQAEAVNRLQAQLQDGLTQDTLHPNQ